MRTRVGLVAVALVAVGLLASACSAGDSSAPVVVDDTTAPTTVTTLDAAPATAAPATAAPQCARDGLPKTVAYDTIDGVDPNLLSIDIHAPAGACGAPVVRWVHGGGYRIGDKAQQVSDKAQQVSDKAQQVSDKAQQVSDKAQQVSDKAQQVSDKVTLFNDKGWILVSVNSRLTEQDNPESANFPDHFDDVASAVAWGHDNIGAYGGDPSRIALLGHSAGADIVSNVTTNPTYLAAHGLGLDSVVCAGPLDTEGFDKVTAAASDPDSEKEQWQAALGENPNYLTETSAILLVKPGIGIPPTIGVVRGSPQRQTIETAYLATLEAAGVATVSIDARSIGHSQVNTQIGAAGDTVMTAPVVAFLTDCFNPVVPKVVP